MKRGWSVGKARRTVVLVMGPTMLALIPAASRSNYCLLDLAVRLLDLRLCGLRHYVPRAAGGCFHSRAVASVSGLSGTGAGIVHFILHLPDWGVADKFSFQPIIIAASLVPVPGDDRVPGMVRAPTQPDPDGIVLQF